MQVAKEAGVAVRSIFERFSDLQAPALATADYAIAYGPNDKNQAGTGGSECRP